MVALNRTSDPIPGSADPEPGLHHFRALQSRNWLKKIKGPIPGLHSPEMVQIGFQREGGAEESLREGKEDSSAESAPLGFRRRRRPYSMASHSSNSRASRCSHPSSERNTLLYEHAIKPMLRVSRTKENPGRRFWGCANYQVKEGCNFFVWADSVYEEEDAEKVKLRRRLGA
ncbi:hypothetical protein PIB30_097530 [Stylosanthes scabra]|uniref:GRF-type domain-containing protein n=1 Tax=Stylosanthes scabra TaxID=79078 RepID=A0ABU6YXQ2_9FABA|nr:hypothetical protein [Stylosanthes scabra]